MVQSVNVNFLVSPEHYKAPMVLDGEMDSPKKCQRFYLQKGAELVHFSPNEEHLSMVISSNHS